MTENEVWEKCRLFSGLDQGARKRAAAFFRAEREAAARGAVLHAAGSVLPRFGLVLSGRVQVFLDDINGLRILMASVGPGDTFGESLALLGGESPVWILAAEETEILWLDPDALRRVPRDEFEHGMGLRFTSMVAARTLTMNFRIQALSKHSLRDKLITFLSQYAGEVGPEFTVPFDRASLAAWLGADRSALSREIGRMRRDGLIECRGSRFRIRTGASAGE